MVLIDRTVCTGCGRCVRDCVSRSLSLKNGKAEYTGTCLLCGHCVAICPSRAVTIPCYDMEDVEDIVSLKRVDVKDVLGAIKSRRSIRDYKAQKVEKEKLDNIIQAGRYTATASNRQACTFILVQERLDQLKEAIWRDVEKAVGAGCPEAKPLEFLVRLRTEKGIDYLFRNAPAVLYVAAENAWDAGLAAQNMELASVSQGLGMLYNGYLVRSTMLSVEAQEEILCLREKPVTASMLLGYPNVRYIRTAPRKKPDVRWL